MLSKRISAIMFGLGCFLFGFVSGILIYGSKWYYDHTGYALYESLNTRTMLAGLTYGTIGGIGIVLLLVGVLNLLKKP